MTRRTTNRASDASAVSDAVFFDGAWDADTQVQIAQVIERIEETGQLEAVCHGGTPWVCVAYPGDSVRHFFAHRITSTEVVRAESPACLMQKLRERFLSNGAADRVAMNSRSLHRA